mmetsp:Transcript_16690/g.33221  ORF Transcript_16690/g.33221 Transcript_16690/m.33221 type:complete len:95 (-) Transcript_16690:444-728(-)
MPRLLRYQKAISLVAVFIAVWYYAAADAVYPPTTAAGAAVAYAPVWAVLALGVYAAGAVAVGVATFADCPEAAAELEGQIAEARAELTRRGVKM